VPPSHADTGIARPIRFNMFLSTDEQEMLDDLQAHFSLNASDTIRKILRERHEDELEDE